MSPCFVSERPTTGGSPTAKEATMHPTTTTIRRLACTAGVVLTALAVFAIGAAAASGASGGKAITPQAEEFIPGVTDVPSSLPGEVGESSGAVSQEQFIPGVTDVPSALAQQGLPVYVQTDESGFDWSAAAAGGIAATLLLLAAALAVRMAKRNRVAVGPGLHP
jgi:hypothetical protein